MYKFDVIERFSRVKAAEKEGKKETLVSHKKSMRADTWSEKVENKEKILTEMMKSSVDVDTNNWPLLHYSSI